MRLNPGDIIKSIHTDNAFVVEYVSADGHCFILQPRDKENSRSYNMHDFNRSFVRVSESDTLQTGNSPLIPDGYALVPVEPTDEMIAAAMECDDVVFDSKDPTAFCVQFREIYYAMVDVAPKPELTSE